MTAASGVKVAPEKEEKDGGMPQAPAPRKSEEAFEEDDHVCFVRRNWGTDQIPADKVDYTDEFAFMGGIGRNIPYGRAKKWLKSQRVLGFILPNNATMEQIAETTGRTPEEPRTIAAAIQAMSADKVAAMLGDDEAVKLARQILQQAGERAAESRQEPPAPPR